MRTGKYLTPPLLFKRTLRSGEAQTFLEGAIYDENYRLVDHSQRLGLGIVSNDPPLLRYKSPLVEICDEQFFYLGHYLQHYGHFLLETMPMLSYLLSDQKSLAFFNEMPFGKVTQKFSYIEVNGKDEILVSIKTDNSLLKSICNLLDIDIKRIRINPSVPMRYSSSGKFIDSVHSSCIMSNFLVAPRPVYMEKKLIDKKPYRIVLNQLLSAVGSDLGVETNYHLQPEKVFIINEPKFFEKSIRDQVASFFESHGFNVVNPLDYSLSQQIWKFRKARVIAGFSGSSLHNSIFSESLERIIEIGREGMVKNNPNQAICADISEAELVFCEYGSYDEIKSRLISLIELSKGFLFFRVSD